MSVSPSITVSSLDLQRLDALLAGLDSKVADDLEDELGRATIVAPEAVPPTVVTMNSTVRFQFEETGEIWERTLCYPKDAEGNDAISILAPVGSALLGLSVGDSIDWPVPSGRARRVRILDLPFQPERAGEFHR